VKITRNEQQMWKKLNNMKKHKRFGRFTLLTFAMENTDRLCPESNFSNVSHGNCKVYEFLCEAILLVMRYKNSGNLLRKSHDSAYLPQGCFVLIVVCCH